MDPRFREVDGIGELIFLNNHARAHSIVRTFINHNKRANGTVLRVTIHHQRLREFELNTRDVVHFQLSGRLLL